MKSRLILLILPVLTVFSCYKDGSNDTIRSINPIVIDMGGAPTSLTGYTLEELEIQPVIYKVGTPDASLSFKWEISTTDMRPAVIGEKMQLKATISVPADANPYTITLTVTDEDTGLQNYQVFSLRVLSSLGQGLLIADTRDGITSDLNLIMAKEFSQGTETFEDKNTKVIYNAYSTINGAPFGELVTDMVSCYDSRSPIPRTLTVITDSHAYRMDPYEYVLEMKDDEMFLIKDLFNGEPIHPEFIGHADMPVYDLMIIDGKVYPRSAQWGDYLYRVAMEPSDNSDYRATMGSSYLTGLYRTGVCFYDDMNNRFLKCAGGYGANDLRLMNAPAKTGPFDLNDLGAPHKALYMGAGYIVDWYHSIFAVMENQQDHKRYLYTFCPGGSSAIDPDYYAIGKYDMSAVPGFGESTAWECSPLENILYYASGNKIYSLVLSGETPVATERYTAPAGETITGIMLWRFTDQGKIWAKNPPGSVEERSLVNSGNQMMVISTYNEATQSGKVTCVPIMYIGSGTLETDTNYHVTFDGFGRILTMAHQPV